MTRKDIIKFFPSYVGSKARWLKHLTKYKDRNFVEIFCGSGVLSANLAKTAILNDLDPYVTKILQEFDKQIIIEPFGEKEYFEARVRPDWYLSSYCLGKLAFSGVFRYSKNGFNVPIKSKKPVYLQEEYERALQRWQELAPKIYNKNYYEINHEITVDSVLVIDPPYQNTQASYNKEAFDYEYYWQYVLLNENICKTVIIFDFLDNMLSNNNVTTQKSRVNGKHEGNIEACFIFEDSLKEGQYGEETFFKRFHDKLRRLDGLKNDFEIIKNNKKIELKSDYYDMSRTKNFFLERFSYGEKDGGPWQALNNKNDYFCYYYVKNDVCFVFDTKRLVERLDEISNKYKLISIPNKNHTTRGYKIPRTELEDIVIKVWESRKIVDKK